MPKNLSDWISLVAGSMLMLISSLGFVVVINEDLGFSHLETLALLGISVFFHVFGLIGVIQGITNQVDSKYQIR